MTRIDVDIPQSQIDYIEEQIKLGDFVDRSDLIRHVLRIYIDEQYNM